METLPKRLAAVASLIPPGKTVADIGTDHGYLPVFLINSGRSSKVIASDIHRGPFERARSYIRSQGLEESIDIRLGRGLQVLQPYEVQVAVIAGLGGETMVEIFAEGREIIASLEGLALNPVTHQSGVRRWLTGNGWRLEDENLVEDQGRLYQIIFACPGKQLESAGWSDLEYEIGPLILRKRHPLLKEYLGRKLKKYERVANNLQFSKSTQTVERLKKLTADIENVEEWYRSLT